MNTENCIFVQIKNLFMLNFLNQNKHFELNKINLNKFLI